MLLNMLLTALPSAALMVPISKRGGTRRVLLGGPQAGCGRPGLKVGEGVVKG